MYPFSAMGTRQPFVSRVREALEGVGALENARDTERKLGSRRETRILEESRYHWDEFSFSRTQCAVERRERTVRSIPVAIFVLGRLPFRRNGKGSDLVLVAVVVTREERIFCRLLLENVGHTGRGVNSRTRERRKTFVAKIRPNDHREREARSRRYTARGPAESFFLFLRGCLG